MYIESIIMNDKGNFMTPDELEHLQGSEYIVEKMLDDYKEVEPSDVIHMMVHASILLEEDHDHELKRDIVVWVEDNERLIDVMFSGFGDLRSDMDKTLLNFCRDYEDNREILETINTYYTTLWGLWLSEEQDPTKGLAWSYLDFVIEKIDGENFALIKDYIRHNLLNVKSANPVQGLWRKILNQGGYHV